MDISARMAPAETVPIAEAAVKVFSKQGGVGRAAGIQCWERIVAPAWGQFNLWRGFNSAHLGRFI